MYIFTHICVCSTFDTNSATFLKDSHPFISKFLYNFFYPLLSFFYKCLLFLNDETHQDCISTSCLPQESVFKLHVFLL